MRYTFNTALAAIFLLLAVGPGNLPRAEPYIAVDKGLACAACHVHPAGGGLRTHFGNIYARMELAADPIIVEGREPWTGELSDWLAIGANFRAAYNYVDTPGAPEVSEFNVERATIYLHAAVIPSRLSLYVDQQVAPGGSLNREAYVRLNDRSGNLFLAAGQFHLPYGWRLQDDSAFVRQFTGVNFNTPDRGVQAGYVSGSWTTVLSLTNGSGGGTEFDTGKQASLVTTFVRPGWRLGFSLNANDSDAGDRGMANVFGGLRTGPISWLGEVDRIEDDLPDGTRRSGLVSLIEANWRIRQGHNLKFSHDWYDPDDDTDEDEQARWSMLWEYSPIQFLQARFGVRIYDGPVNLPATNREQFFAELHGFF